ncbi:MAG: DNA-binding protein [Candidatus Aenigmarchaeota archaeon]|nr:DNA-binding protein [Candidatus Aenigmarchaeota archaeon]MCX8179354.1 DNA-binding protein [Candidatus Aenigmarchaeota archaeon]
MSELEDIEKIKEMERVKKIILGRILTKEASERLARLKIVKPELANQLEIYLVKLYQAGQIKRVIDDNQMKNILSQISERKEFRIRR